MPATTNGNGKPQVYCTAIYIFSESRERKIGQVISISEQGALIACADPEPVGSFGKVRLRFRQLDNPIEVDAEVVWSNKYGPNDAITPRGMGIQFRHLEQDTARLLANLADSLGPETDRYSVFYC